MEDEQEHAAGQEEQAVEEGTLPTSASAAATGQEVGENEETMEVEEDGIGSAALADVKEESSVEEAAGESEVEEGGMEVGGDGGAFASASEAEEEEGSAAEGPATFSGSESDSEGKANGAESGQDGEGEQEDEEMAMLATKNLVPPKSAWMLFSMDMRDAVKREQPLLKVTEQVKALSAKWKALDDAARRPYLERAAADKQRYLAEKEALAAAKAAIAARNKKKGEVSASSSSTSGPRQLDDEMHFPIARIKRIMKLDPEVKSASKDATLLVAKATELFLDMLGEEASKASGRRKTLKALDVAAGMRRKEALAFLRPDFSLDDAAALGTGGGAGGKKKAEAPKLNAVAKLVEADRKARKAKQAAAAAEASSASKGEGLGQEEGGGKGTTTKKGGKGANKKPVVVKEGKAAITAFFSKGGKQ